MMRDMLRSLFGFGTVQDSKLNSVNTVLVTIRDLGSDQDAQELWGNAAVLFRPAAPDAAGSLEVAHLRVDDELVAFASRDNRNQLALAVGEVMVRGFGANAATVLLKPDGTAVVTSSAVQFTGDVQVDGDLTVDGEVSANAALPATEVKLSTHIHQHPMGPTSSPTPGT